MTNIPPGYTTVFPYFFMKDAEGFCAFLVDALGGEEVGRTVIEGRIANARIRLGTATVMVSEASADWPPMPASYYIYVEDADVSQRRAIAAGAEQIMPVADQPYGDRQGGVRDAWGNLWWISQHLGNGYD